MASTPCGASSTSARSSEWDSGSWFGLPKNKEERDIPLPDEVDLRRAARIEAVERASWEIFA